jgi:hypothetical protein
MSFQNKPIIIMPHYIATKWGWDIRQDGLHFYEESLKIKPF